MNRTLNELCLNNLNIWIFFCVGVDIIMFILYCNLLHFAGLVKAHINSKPTHTYTAVLSNYNSDSVHLYCKSRLQPPRCHDSC